MNLYRSYKIQSVIYSLVVFVLISLSLYLATSLFLDSVKNKLNYKLYDVTFIEKQSDIKAFYNSYDANSLNFAKNLQTKTIDAFIILQDGKIYEISRANLVKIFPIKLMVIYIFLILIAIIFLLKLNQESYPAKLLYSIFNYTHDAIFITDKDGKVIQLNDMFLKILNYKKEVVLGQQMLFKSTKSSTPLENEISEEVKKTGFWQGEFITKDSSGNEIPQILTIKELSCRPKKYLCAFYPLDEYKNRIKNLEQIAYHDGLTNLPNKRYFETLLTKEMSKAKKTFGYKMALLYLDFDDFKVLNDTYGHGVGDEFLKLVSFSLKSCLGKDDVLGRLSGDEFGVILADIKDEAHLEKIISEILNVGRTKFNIGEDLQIGTSLSIGAVIYPTIDDIGFKELIKRADKAMYTAKMQNKGKFTIYKDIEFNNK